VAVLAAASIGGWWLGASRPNSNSTYVVTRALDGDTVDVQNARGHIRVRLLGLNTPEIEHPGQPVQCYGPEAARFTAAQLTGRAVTLEYDRERYDKYDRTLAYVLVAGHRFNDKLLRLGYARLLIIPPNGKYGRTMLDEELEARRAHRGLWGAC